MLAQREQILQSWIAEVDQHPNISTSDNLTYTQLLDHLPELCTELAALLKRPNAQEIKREATQDARAHGWKRWRQGYKLEELIREICLIRRNFIDTWLKAFAAVDEFFDVDAENAARRVVESFFDNVIIEATVQFVEERQEAVHQLHAGLKPTATTIQNLFSTLRICCASRWVRFCLDSKCCCAKKLCRREALK